MTASRALNDKPGVSDKTREDIQRIASEMGYVANPLAQKLSNGRTHIIGVVAPASHLLHRRDGNGHRHNNQGCWL